MEFLLPSSSCFHGVFVVMLILHHNADIAVVQELLELFEGVVAADIMMYR